MAAIHADPALFGLTVYSQGGDNPFQLMEVQDEVMNNFSPGDYCPCKIQDDFIIVAEFSEVTGPIPLLTIPSKLDNIGEIDINALIMKIMSVDYQANPSGQFAFCQDVQVVQCEVLPGRHAYVHYCTLHDLHARGFVRPLCLAYICADYMKLQAEFDKLRKKFLTAIEILKYNNRQAFITEISHILENMKKLQKKYFSWKKKEEGGEMLSTQECREMACLHLDQLAHHQSELCHMLLAAELLQDDSCVEEKLLEWQRALEYSCEAECRLFVSQVHVVPHACTSLPVSIGPPGSREPLRSVPALSPWGMVVMLWHLLSIQRSLRRCRLHTSLSMFSSEYGKNQLVDDSAVEGLTDGELLQLLVSASQPFQSQQDCPYVYNLPIDGLKPGSLEFMEANLMASGNEASSSYHSAPESLSESMVAGHIDGEVPSGCISVSFESILNVPTDSDSNDPLLEEEEEEEEEVDVPETWLSCVWSVDVPLGPNWAGRHLVRFFQHYPQAAQHVVLSLLIGRTVVVAGGEALRDRVRNSLVALSALIPTSSQHIMWWHRGILVSSHILDHHLIGICVPERLSVHDMISPRDKNSVTILEVANGRLWGPAYSGELLVSLEITPSALSSDHTLLLLLRSIADILREKLFLLRCGSFASSVGEALCCLGLTGCDAKILRYLLCVEVNI